MFNKILLAWLQVTREKTRLAVAISRIAFADLLIFIQMGNDYRQGCDSIGINYYYV